MPEGRRDCGTGRRSSYSSSYAASESSASSLASSSARPRGKSSSLSSSSYPSSNVLRLVRALDCGGGPPLLRPPLPPLLRPPPPPPLDRRGAPRLGLLAASAKGEDPPLMDDTKSRARTEVAIVILIVSYFSHKMCCLLISGPRGEDTGYIYHESTAGTIPGGHTATWRPSAVRWIGMMVPIGGTPPVGTTHFVRGVVRFKMVRTIRSTDSQRSMARHLLFADRTSVPSKSKGAERRQKLHEKLQVAAKRLTGLFWFCSQGYCVYYSVSSNPNPQ